MPGAYHDDVESITSNLWESTAMRCKCCELSLGVPECPVVTVEAKSACGEASRPSPCGFFNPDDEQYYLTKTTTRWYEVRPIDPAPPMCWYSSSLPIGGVISHTKRDFASDDAESHDFTSLEIITFALDDECACLTPSVETETDSYELTRRHYTTTTILEPPGSAPAGCEGPMAGPSAPLVTEIDPDASGETVEYTGLWTCEVDVMAAATDAMNEAFSAASWDGAAEAGAIVSRDEDGNVTSAVHCKAEVRVRLIGGNTGYVRVEWETRDQDDEVVSSGTVEHAWEPNPDAPLDVTLDVTVMGVDYPAPAAGETKTNSLNFWITLVTCEPIA